MATHPPTAGIAPEPAQYNVLNTKKLLDQWFNDDLPRCRRGARTELTLLKCDGCNDPVNLNDGYPFLDDFICDLCMRRLLATMGGIAYAK